MDASNNVSFAFLKVRWVSKRLGDAFVCHDAATLTDSAKGRALRHHDCSESRA